MIRGIIFDKDGTLTDFHATWAAITRELLGELARGNADLFSRLARALDFDPESLGFGAHSPAVTGPAYAVTDALAPHLPDMSREAIDDLVFGGSDPVPQVPAVDLPPLFRRLADEDGYQLGIVTNDSEASARAHLMDFGVAHYVTFVAGVDSGHGAKPDPGPLLAFSRTSGLEPASVVMVGDSAHDLRAGRAARMTTVGVLTGAADPGTLAPYADAILPDIGHVPDWLADR